MATGFDADFLVGRSLHCSDEIGARVDTRFSGIRTDLFGENPIERLSYECTRGKAFSLSQSVEPGFFLRFERQSDCHCFSLTLPRLTRIRSRSNRGVMRIYLLQDF